MELLIARQRQLINDTFQTSQLRDLPAEKPIELKTTQDDIADSSRNTQKAVQTMNERVAEQLGLAITQMKNASEQLAQAELALGQKHEDQALSLMLQARDHLVRVLQQSQQQSNSARTQPSRPSLKPQISATDLAKLAEELARKEQDIHEKTALALEQPSMPEGSAESIHRRQEEVVNESHILLSEMQESDRASLDTVKIARQLDTSVVETFQRMKNGQYRDCLSTLKTDAQEYSRLAQILRGLDPQNVAETLAEASRMSKRAAEQMTQVCQQCRSGSAQSNRPSASAEQQASSAGGSSPQTGEKQETATEDPKESRSEQARTLSNVARDTATVSHWIGHLRRSESLDARLLDRLTDLSRDVDLDRLPLDVDLARQLDQQRRESRSLPLKEDVAERLGQLGKRLQREAERLNQGQLERLAEADSLARQLEERNAPRARPNPPAAAGSTGRYASATTADLRADLVEALEDLDDEILQQLAPQLASAQPAPRVPSTLTVPRPSFGPIQLTPPRAERTSDSLLSSVRKRLATLMDQILREQLAVAELEDAVPDEYRNLVDRYLQTLSDDLE